MISWGTKFDLVGVHDDLPPQDCTVCSFNEKPAYHVEQGYFTLYGLSLLKTKTKYYKICGSCKARLKVRSTEPNLSEVKRAVPSPLKLKYIWGWLILLPILLGIAYFFMSFSK